MRDLIIFLGLAVAQILIVLLIAKHLFRKSRSPLKDGKHVTKNMSAGGSVSRNPSELPDELKKLRFDPENLNLGFQSISMQNGHASTQVTYYAALHQVVIVDARYQKDCPPQLSILRIDLPDHLKGKNEILSYCMRVNPIIAAICR